MRETISERPAYASAHRSDQDQVTLTWTFGDGDDHEHADIKMTTSEALELVAKLVKATGLTIEWCPHHDQP